MCSTEFLQMLGTWFGALGTIAAVCTALLLARRRKKVKLNAHVGLRGRLDKDNSEGLNIGVSNIGELSATINPIIWCIGRGKNKQYKVHVSSLSSHAPYPEKIEPGDTAWFSVNTSETPNWIKEFSVEGFVKDKPIKTLRVRIYASGMPIVTVKPEKGLLNKLKEARAHAHP